ncbi:MAG: TIGR03757 family integrating conjugative element protein [Azoarcus sp.]|jgi:integrating conjugative element protein (TIGR03757 family)|nr:TIGR03757 family integrating conjugative element protein [Azoarcus sp.]
MSRRFLFLAFGCAFAVHAGAADIRVYTDHSIALQHTRGAKIVFLDAPQHLEQALSAGLPADAGRAGVIARQRLQAGGAHLRREFANAWQGVTDAWRLGITKIPAVVADGRYVIYGESDVAKAVARIAAFRSKKP